MFTERLGLLKCPVCETVVEVLAPCGLELTCCGPAMVPLNEKAAEDNHGSHAVVVNWTDDTVQVRIGGPGHPMDESHHISWVEVIAGDRRHRQFLKPGQKANVSFTVNAQSIQVRAYCTVHGLWKSGQIHQAESVGKIGPRSARMRAAV